jgi:hypothetical protein
LETIGSRDGERGQEEEEEEEEEEEGDKKHLCSGILK